MKREFCPYCGSPLSDCCECAYLAELDYEEFIESYYNDPLVNEGFCQQDTIDMYRRER